MWELIREISQYAIAGVIAYLAYLTRELKSKASRVALDKVESACKNDTEKVEQRVYDLEKKLFEQVATKADITRIETQIIKLQDTFIDVLRCQKTDKK